MELLEGQTLGRRIAERPLRIEEILDLGSQVLEALEAAHAKGVIYRDVTPANIFITRHGTAKLLDLELAKLIEERPPVVVRQACGRESWERRRPTRRTIVPSAAYMSPERARGEQLDARSDIFSLGAVLYHMATGTTGFPGEHVRCDRRRGAQQAGQAAGAPAAESPAGILACRNQGAGKGEGPAVSVRKRDVARPAPAVAR